MQIIPPADCHLPHDISWLDLAEEIVPLHFTIYHVLGVTHIYTIIILNNDRRHHQYHLTIYLRCKSITRRINHHCRHIVQLRDR